MWTFLSANATALADFQIGLKPVSFFHDALGGAVNPAGGALHTFISVHDRALRTPVTGPD
jgi:hypothetical protein